jgi:hypothetical protein
MGPNATLMARASYIHGRDAACREDSGPTHFVKSPPRFTLDAPSIAGSNCVPDLIASASKAPTSRSDFCADMKLQPVRVEKRGISVRGKKKARIIGIDAPLSSRCRAQ